MQDYVPPIADYRFLLTDVLDFDGTMQALEREVDADLAVAVLEEAGKLCVQTLAPLNRVGDEQGSQLADGSVQTPAGFPDAYQTFAAGGWASLSADPAHGGQGLPFILHVLLI